MFSKEWESDCREPTPGSPKTVSYVGSRARPPTITTSLPPLLAAIRLTSSTVYTITSSQQDDYEYLSGERHGGDFHLGNLSCRRLCGLDIPSERDSLVCRLLSWRRRGLGRIKNRPLIGRVSLQIQVRCGRFLVAKVMKHRHPPAIRRERCSHQDWRTVSDFSHKLRQGGSRCQRTQRWDRPGQELFRAWVRA